MIEQLRQYFIKRKQKRELDTQNWLNTLEPRFHDTAFPILIIDPPNGYIATSVDDYTSNPDIYFHKFADNVIGIDADGQSFCWHFDESLHANVPSDQLEKLNLESCKLLLSEEFPRLDRNLYSAGESIRAILSRLPKEL